MSTCLRRTQSSIFARGHPALGKELGEEFAVVDLGRPGRDLVGDLPSHDGERPLPCGDVMVFGVRDHAVEIEENGFRRHALSSIRQARIGPISLP